MWLIRLTLGLTSSRISGWTFSRLSSWRFGQTSGQISSRISSQTSSQTFNKSASRKLLSSQIKTWFLCWSLFHSETACVPALTFSWKLNFSQTQVKLKKLSLTLYMRCCVCFSWKLYFSQAQAKFKKIECDFVYALLRLFQLKIAF